MPDSMPERPGEFPAGVASPPAALSRRDFVRLLGASAALAGVYGCTRAPREPILPYVREPADVTPGVPAWYATATALDGFATGLLVESHDGRPTKVEGNPDHPASLGAAGVFEQASVLGLYDPHRARQVTRGAEATRSAAAWDDVARLLAPAAMRQRVGARGDGLRLLLEPTSSPLTLALLDRVRALYPAAAVHVYAPFAWPNEALLPQCDLTRADVVVALDGDFLTRGPFALRYSHDWGERRRAPGGPNRFYAAESRYTATGAKADHRLAVRPSEVAGVADALLAAVRAARGGAVPNESGVPHEAWVHAAARDLVAAAGRGIVLAGPHAGAHVRGVVRELNTALGNTASGAAGRDAAPVWYTRSPLLGASLGGPVAPLAELVGAAGRGVDTLLVLGGNPVYDAPADLDVARALAAVPNALYLGLHANETARRCAWHVPAAHDLERWGDVRAYDGTASVVQPLIAPLYEGRTADEVLAACLGDGAARAHDLVRAQWRAGRAGDFDTFWNEILRRGVVPDSAAARVADAPTDSDSRASGDALIGRHPREVTAGLEVVLAPSPTVHDGRFANNAWLQELPEPMTTLTWGNAAHLSPATAARLGVVDGDVVAFGAGGRTVRLPALVLLGVADGVAVLHAGYGRDGAEETARGVGTSVYPLFTSALFTGDAPHARGGVTATAADAHQALARTQPHWRMEGRDVARTVTVGASVRDEARPHGAPSRRPLPLYERKPDAPHQWAMTIDLDRCTGCLACVVACQAENNVPVVGREGVLDGREMHWLRVDRYVEAPDHSVSQPVLCQHCEDAPCEYVCPVEATVHSPDGLNEMVYNRCVGTRFCSNNCPYKVRRFNWFDYNADVGPVGALAKNPDVTVRARGVMEKCTFCVQRIREGEIAASSEHRTLGGDEVRTACQQACPSRAIVFGSMTDPTSAVARERRDPRAYALLDELGTAPRVQYLARVRNPDPALGDAGARAADAAA